LSAKRIDFLLPGTAALTLIADQLSKSFIRAHLRLGESWIPFPALGRWFAITHVTNTGAAFGLFPQMGLVFVAIAVVVVAAIVIYYRHLPAEQWLVRVSLGLQLGGALGNLIDRLRYGHVTDFLDFKVWPVFNVADSAIVVGVAILAYCLLRDQEG